MALVTDDTLAVQLRKLLPLSDSLEIFSRLYSIFAHSHIYFKSWKELNLEPELTEEIIGIVRRFEGTFQLKGLGIWLLYMLLCNISDRVSLQALGSLSTLNTILRISLEFNVQDKCVRYFVKCINLKLATYKDICSIVSSISDQLPMPIKYGNFMDMFKFAVIGISRDPSSANHLLGILRLLIPRVEVSPKANYFIPIVWTQSLSRCLTFEDAHLSLRLLQVLTAMCYLHNKHASELLSLGVIDAAISHLRSANANSGNEMRQYVVNTALLQFLTACSHDPHVLAYIRGTYSPVTLVGYICKAPAPDPLDCDSETISQLPDGCLDCDRVAAVLELYNVLYQFDDVGVNNDAKACFMKSVLGACCDLLALHSGADSKPGPMDLAAGDPTNNSISLRGLSDFTSSETGLFNVVNYSVFPYTSLSTSRRICQAACSIIKNSSKFYVLTEAFGLRDQIASIRSMLFGHIEELDSEVFVEQLHFVDALVTVCGQRCYCWIRDPVCEDQQLLAHAALVNDVIELTENRVNSMRLDGPVSPIKAAEAANFASDLQVESLSVSSRMGEDGNANDIITYTRCASSSNIPFSGDKPVSVSPSAGAAQIAFSVIPPASPRQRSRSLNAGELAFSSMKGGPLSAPAGSPGGANRERSASDSNSLKYMGIKLFVKHETDLKETFSDWAIVPTATLFHHLTLIFIIGATAGFSFLEPLFNISEFGDILLEILTDDRLGLDQFPGMLEICLNLFTFIARESISVEPGLELHKCLKAHPIPHAAAVCDYVIGILSNEEHVIAEDNFLYQCLSLITALCPYDRQCRRASVKAFSKIFQALFRRGSSVAVAPLLKLISRLQDCIGKIDANGDNDGVEALLSVIVCGLQMHNCSGDDVCLMTCKTIAEIGTDSPGLAHRLFMRREVEDLLALFLRRGRIGEVTSHCANPNIIPILKACIVCVKDLNPNPFWQYTSFSYHWTTYADGLPARPLIGPQAVQVLATLCVSCDAKYRLLVLTSCLEYATALMFNCCDGNFARPFAGLAPEKKIDYGAIVKAELVRLMLPFIPNALGIVISRRNSKIITIPKAIDQSLVGGVSASELASSGVDSPGETGLSGQFAELGVNEDKDYTTTSKKPSKKRGIMKTMKSGLKGTFGLISKKSVSDNADASTSANSNNQGQDNPEPVVEGGKDKKKSSLQYSKELIFNSMAKQEKPQTPTYRNSVSALRPSLYRSWSATAETVVNRSLEGLAEKTVEALFAFLCLEDMFPLSTYLRNVNLFRSFPVASCLAYSMAGYPENVLIQQRGIEVFRIFAENKVDISHLGMHAPVSLLVALKKFDDNVKLQISFCKIVKILASSDDFARDNLIRYSIQNGLSSILRQGNLDCSLLAVQALCTMVASPADAQCMCEGCDVVNSIIYSLELFANDNRIQIEGLRALLAVSDTAEFVEAMQSPGAEATLKKSRKSLTAALKSQKIANGYTAEDIQEILDDPQLASLNDKCVIS